MHLHISLCFRVYTDTAGARSAVILLGCSCFLLQSILLNDTELIMNVVSAPNDWAGSSHSTSPGFEQECEDLLCLF